MGKYFLLPRAIWLSGELTVDKIKNTICSLKLSFPFCHVRNKLGLPTWAGLGSKMKENIMFKIQKELFSFILLSNQQTSRTETGKIMDKGECMQPYDIFPHGLLKGGHEVCGSLKLLKRKISRAENPELTDFCSYFI